MSHILLHRRKVYPTGSTVRLSVSSDEVPLAALETGITLLANQALAAIGGCLAQILGNQLLLVSTRLYSKLGT